MRTANPSSPASADIVPEQDVVLPDAAAFDPLKAHASERERILKALKLTEAALLAISDGRLHYKLIDLYIEAMGELEAILDRTTSEASSDGVQTTEAGLGNRREPA